MVVNVHDSWRGRCSFSGISSRIPRESFKWTRRVTCISYHGQEEGDLGEHHAPGTRAPHYKLPTPLQTAWAENALRRVLEGCTGLLLPYNMAMLIEKPKATILKGD